MVKKTEFFIILCIFFLGLLSGTSDPMKTDLLHIACAEGNYNEVINLLNQGVDINARSLGMTPLMTLASTKNSNIKIANILINRGAAISETNNQGFTAFHFAAEQGNYALLRLLYENGANINALTNRKDTSLMLVIENFSNNNNSYYDSVKFILEKEIDTNIVNINGRSALIHAVINGDIIIINMLMEKDTDPNIIDGVTGNSALYWACLSENAYSILKILLAHDADINIKNNYTCETPLHAAAIKGNLKVVKLLINNNADKDSSDFKGKTALAKATEKGNERVLKYLLDISAKDAGIPISNCYHLDNKVKSYQKNDKNNESYIKLLNTLLLNCNDATRKWSENHCCFLSSNILKDIEASASTFFWHYYFESNIKRRDKIINFVSDSGKIYLAVDDYLEQIDNSDTKTICTFASKIANKAGLNFNDTGWPCEQYKTYWIYCMPNEYISLDRYYYSNDTVTNITAYKKVLLKYGSNLFILRNSDSVSSLTISFLPGMRDPAIDLMKAKNNDKGILVNPSRIEVSINYICGDLYDGLGNPLSNNINHPRSAKEKRESSDHLFTIAEFYIINKTNNIFNDYELLSTSILRSLSLWKNGCTQCDRSFFSVVIINNRYYIDTYLFDLICYCRDYDLDFSNLFNKYTHNEPIDNISTLELTYSHINLRPFEGYQDISIFNDSLLLEEINKVYPNYVRYDVELKNNNLFCTSDQKIIACANPNNRIELNLGSYKFTTKYFFLKDMLDFREYCFGYGSDKVDLLYVISHEIGHLFRIPHLNINSSLNGRYNIMYNEYNHKGFCITKNNLVMFGNALTNNWEYALEKCDGLRFNKDKM